MGHRGRDGQNKIKQLNAAKLRKAQKEFTRAKAEKLIARTTDPDVLTSDKIAKHQNRHVKEKAAAKLARLNKE